MPDETWKDKGRRLVDELADAAADRPQPNITTQKERAAHAAILDAIAARLKEVEGERDEAREEAARLRALLGDAENMIEWLWPEEEAEQQRVWPTLEAIGAALADGDKGEQ